MLKISAKKYFVSLILEFKNKFKGGPVCSKICNLGQRLIFWITLRQIKY